MPTVNLTPTTGSSYQLFNTAGSRPDLPVGVGDADILVCMQTQGDGKFARADNTGSTDSGVGFLLNAAAQIPSGATINSVAIIITHRNNSGVTTGTPSTVIYTADHSIDIATDTSGFTFYDEFVNSGFTTSLPGAVFEDWHVADYTPVDINPLTGIAWTRNDLITLNVGLDNNSLGSLAPGSLYDIDYFAFVVSYSGGVTNPCWYNPLTNQWQSAATTPGVGWFEVACPLPNAQTTINPVFGSTAGGD